MSSDKHLIRAIKGGDTKSFDELFEKYYDRYFSFACALLHDENAAEDVLQNVFLKIWIGRDRLDETRNLESYLLVSVRNEIFDHLRLKYNQTSVYDDVSEKEDMSADIEAGIALSETSLMMNQMISQMPSQRQRVFMMSRYENMSSKEIADRLGLSVRTVDNHIYLALRDLKQIIS
jgi:RNA polymerase sigma-70 factor (ECF subfamily)